MRIDSQLTDLVPPNLPYLLYEQELIKHFPSHGNYITLVAVEGQGAWSTEQAANTLSAALRQEPELFKKVYYFGDLPFLERNGLLYLDTAEIQNLVDNLAAAQGVLSQLAQTPNLQGVAQLIKKALAAHHEGEALPEEFASFLNQLADSINAFKKGRPASDFWDTAFLASPNSHIRVILVHGLYEHDAFFPAKKHINRIRELAKTLNLKDKYNASVRLTGETVLEQERLTALQQLASFAIFLSAALVLGVLWLGTSSLLVALAIGLCLFTGLSLSMGLALFFTTLDFLFTFSHFTVAFAVMFIGIGADFFIHVAGRSLEEKHVLQGTSRSLWAVFVCFLTSAAGFFTFYPTDYQGLGQLGLISSISLIIALVLAFTLLPALLSKISLRHKKQPYNPFLERAYTGLTKHHRLVLLLCICVGVGAAFGAFRIPFDFSPLSVSEPDKEALSTLKHLQKRGIVTQYTISILANNRSHAQQLASKLEDLDVVRKVSTHTALVPKNQEEKIFLLEEAQLFLLPTTSISSNTSSPDPVLALKELHDALQRYPPKNSTLHEATSKLSHAVQGLLDIGMAAQFEHSFMKEFPARLKRMRTSLFAKTFTFDELPKNFKAQKESPEGKIWVQIFPAEDVSDFKKLSAFARDVLSVAPTATAHPVGEYIVGNIIKKSLAQALTLAFFVIVLILLFALPHWRFILSVLAPVLLTCLCTAATMVALGIDFNHITVIIPPLVIGLGVDHGIHLAWRTQEEGAVPKALASGTFRAVLVSSLTTLCSFFSLSFSTNPGIQDMGIGLSVAMLYTILFTFVLAPALLAWQTSGSTERVP